MLDKKKRIIVTSAMSILLTIFIINVSIPQKCRYPGCDKKANGWRVDWIGIGCGWSEYEAALMLPKENADEYKWVPERGAYRGIIQETDENGKGRNTGYCSKRHCIEDN